MVPPGSVQREQHSWARVLPQVGWGRAQPAGRGLVLSVLGRGLPGTGKDRRTCFVPRAGQAQSLRARTQGPSGIFPKPAAGMRRKWGQALREAELPHSHAHSHTLAHHTDTHTYKSMY